MSKQPKLFKEDEIEICDALKLEEANPFAYEILSLVDAHCSKVQVVGSIRRQKPIVRDVDFVCIAKSPTEWRKVGKELELMLNAKLKVKDKTVSGDKIRRMLVPFKERGYVQVDFYNSTPETWGIYELIRTGSADHNIWLARHALRNGMQLRYSVGLVKDGNVLASKNEKEIFSALGLEWIPPPQREMKRGKPVWQE